MISENLQKQIIEAMKAHDSIRVSTLRMLNSELKNAVIDKGGPLNEEEELKVIQKEAKKRRDAIEALRQAQDKDSQNESFKVKVASEHAELEILNAYLPADLTDEELSKLVEEAITESGATSSQEMGKIMPVLMPKVAGRADGKRVSEMVKQKLS